jgi:hypothetical protein
MPKFPTDPANVNHWDMYDHGVNNAQCSFCTMDSAVLGLASPLMVDVEGTVLVLQIRLHSRYVIGNRSCCWGQKPKAACARFNSIPLG